MNILTDIRIFKGDDMILFGKLFTENLSGNEIISLSGELGSGKTTFVKGASIALNIKEEIISPTFVILREYRGLKPLYHFDFYRLEKLSELLDLNFFDIIYLSGIKFIEWGDKFTELEKYYDYIIKFEISSLMERNVRVYTNNE